MERPWVRIFDRALHFRVQMDDDGNAGETIKPTAHDQPHTAEDERKFPRKTRNEN